MSTYEQSQNPRNFGEAVGEHVRIFQREGNGIWYANYQHAGKQIRVSLKTKNKKQATKEAMKLDIQLQEGTYQQKTETKSIAEALDLYLTQHVNGLKKQTKKRYTRVLKKMQEICASTRRSKLGQIDLALIDAFKFARSHEKKKVQPNTIRQDVLNIQTFVNWCLARKYLQQDPLAELKVPPPRSAEQPWWAWDIVERILGESPEEMRSAFAILAFTGMRSGELCWLTWDDVDFQENNIYIRPKDGWEPKSKDQRVVPILPELLPYLRSLPRNSRWVVSTPVSRQQPVAGKQLTGNGLYKQVKRLLKKLALEGHVHTFRHSFISYCVSQGKEEVFIRAWVGHVDSKILRRYTHINSKQSQAAMKSLSQIVKPLTPGTGGEEKKTA